MNNIGKFLDDSSDDSIWHLISNLGIGKQEGEFGAFLQRRQFNPSNLNYLLAGDTAEVYFNDFQIVSCQNINADPSSTLLDVNVAWAKTMIDAYGQIYIDDYKEYWNEARERCLASGSSQAQTMIKDIDELLRFVEEYVSQKSQPNGGTIYNKT